MSLPTVYRGPNLRDSHDGNPVSDKTKLKTYFYRKQRNTRQYTIISVLSLVFYIAIQCLCIVTVWHSGFHVHSRPNEVNTGAHRGFVTAVTFAHSWNWDSPNITSLHMLLKGYARKFPVKERFVEILDSTPGTVNLTETAKRLMAQFITVRGLIARAQQYCNNTVSTLAYHSARIQDVILNPVYTQRPSQRAGTLKLKSETDAGEFLKLQKGLLELSTNCSESQIDLMSVRKGRLTENWNSYLVRRKDTDIRHAKSRETGVVVVRYEYANLYWCIVDLYNVFLILRLWELSPENAVIILADSHPRSTLDDLWDIYGAQLRLGQLNKTRIHFQSLIWMSHRQYDSILPKGPPYPLFPEFRQFVNNGFKRRVLSKNRGNEVVPLVIVLIWRRDYTAHPRNPGGVIGRKILNEQELLNSTINTFPDHVVRGVQLDQYTISEQLRIISQTDILVGMHGAGLAYGAFLPPGSGMLELFPMFYLRNPNNHMEGLARGNGVLYRSWYNRSPVMEDRISGSLILPVKHVIRLIRNLKVALCNNNEINLANLSSP